jgi:hypothetical protein
MIGLWSNIAKLLMNFLNIFSKYKTVLVQRNSPSFRYILNPYFLRLFLTGITEKLIKVWDQRNLSSWRLWLLHYGSFWYSFTSSKTVQCNLISEIFSYIMKARWNSVFTKYRSASSKITDVSLFLIIFSKLFEFVQLIKFKFYSWEQGFNKRKSIINLIIYLDIRTPVVGSQYVK